MTSAGRHLALPAEAPARIATRRPFAFRHALAEHPLLSIDALAALADRLPPPLALVERFGDRSFVPPHESRGAGRPSPGDLVRDIASNGCWADLRHVEQVPGYRDLMNEILDTALAGLPRLARECWRRESFIFITAPNAVTPVHADPEHNFYLQVRGTKNIRLAPLAALDRDALTAWRLARGYEGGYRRPLETPAAMETFTVTPGTGLYMPVYAIHAVRNTDEISVALSVTCRTLRTEREYLGHALARHVARLRPRRHGNGVAPVREDPATGDARWRLDSR
jgi:hypothetical protein